VATGKKTLLSHGWFQGLCDGLPFIHGVIYCMQIHIQKPKDAIGID
jgi:hypothetical protein